MIQYFMALNKLPYNPISSSVSTLIVTVLVNLELLPFSDIPFLNSSR